MNEGSTTKVREVKATWPVVVVLALVAIWVVLFTVDGIIRYWKMKRQGATPIFLGPLTAWVNMVVRFPAIVLMTGLAIPSFFSYLALASSGWTIQPDLKFRDYVREETDIRFTQDAFETAMREQSDTILGNTLPSGSGRRLNNGLRTETLWSLTLYFKAVDETAGVFAKKSLNTIWSLEDRIKKIGNYESICLELPTGGCQEPAGFSYAQALLSKSRSNYEGTIEELIKQSIDWWFGKEFLYNERWGVYTRSTFRGGVSRIEYETNWTETQRVHEEWLQSLYDNVLSTVDGDDLYKHIHLTWQEDKFLKSYETGIILKHDIQWSLGSFGLVLLCLRVQTKSSIVTLMALIGILLSFTATYYCHHVILDYSEMSILNFISVFLVIGIAADDVLVLTSAYEYSESLVKAHGEPHLRMRWAYKEAALTMLVTTVTSCASFFSLCLSSLPVVRSFGWFMGILLAWNYINVMTILPTSILLTVYARKQYIDPIKKWIAEKLPKFHTDDSENRQRVADDFTVAKAMWERVQGFKQLMGRVRKSNSFREPGFSLLGLIRPSLISTDSDYGTAEDDLNFGSRLLGDEFLQCLNKCKFWLIALMICFGAVAFTLGVVNVKQASGDLQIFYESRNLGRVEYFSKNVFASYDQAQLDDALAKLSGKNFIVDPCDPPCRNNGQCVESGSHGAFRCKCASNYVGADCSYPFTNGTLVLNTAALVATHIGKNLPGTIASAPLMLQNVGDHDLQWWIKVDDASPAWISFQPETGIKGVLRKRIFAHEEPQISKAEVNVFVDYTNWIIGDFDKYTFSIVTMNGVEAQEQHVTVYAGTAQEPWLRDLEIYANLSFEGDRESEKVPVALEPRFSFWNHRYHVTLPYRAGRAEIKVSSPGVTDSVIIDNGKPTEARPAVSAEIYAPPPGNEKNVSVIAATRNNDKSAPYIITISRAVVTQPDPPELLRVIGMNGGLKVEFRPADFDGGVPIHDYIIEAEAQQQGTSRRLAQGQGPHSVSLPAEQCTFPCWNKAHMKHDDTNICCRANITGLDNSKYYEVYIRANSSSSIAGVSEPSEFAWPSIKLGDDVKPSIKGTPVVKKMQPRHALLAVESFEIITGELPIAIVCTAEPGGNASKDSWNLTDIVVDGLNASIRYQFSCKFRTPDGRFSEPSYLTDPVTASKPAAPIIRSIAIGSKKLQIEVKEEDGDELESVRCLAMDSSSGSNLPLAILESIQDEVKSHVDGAKVDMGLGPELLVGVAKGTIGEYAVEMDGRIELDVKYDCRCVGERVGVFGSWSNPVHAKVVAPPEFELGSDWISVESFGQSGASGFSECEACPKDQSGCKSNRIAGLDQTSRVRIADVLPEKAYTVDCKVVSTADGGENYILSEFDVQTHSARASTTYIKTTSTTTVTTTTRTSTSTTSSSTTTTMTTSTTSTTTTTSTSTTVSRSTTTSTITNMTGTTSTGTTTNRTTTTSTSTTTNGTTATRTTATTKTVTTSTSTTTTRTTSTSTTTTSTTTTTTVTTSTSTTTTMTTTTVTTTTTTGFRPFPPEILCVRPSPEDSTSIEMKVSAAPQGDGKLETNAILNVTCCKDGVTPCGHVIAELEEGITRTTYSMRIYGLPRGVGATITCVAYSESGPSDVSHPAPSVAPGFAYTTQLRFYVAGPKDEMDAEGIRDKLYGYFSAELRKQGKSLEKARLLVNGFIANTSNDDDDDACSDWDVLRAPEARLLSEFKYQAEYRIMMTNERDELINDLSDSMRRLWSVRENYRPFRAISIFPMRAPQLQTVSWSDSSLEFLTIASKGRIHTLEPPFDPKVFQYKVYVSGLSFEVDAQAHSLLEETRVDVNFDTDVPVEFEVRNLAPDFRLIRVTVESVARTRSEYEVRVFYHPRHCSVSCGRFGECNNFTGLCDCKAGYYGAICDVHCPSYNGAACSGHGVCDLVRRRCICLDPYKGEDCALMNLHGYCNGGGVVNVTNGFAFNYSERELFHKEVDREPEPVAEVDICMDTDDGAKDRYGDFCANYVSQWCGNYDDADFTSDVMCCTCGGGRRQAEINRTFLVAHINATLQCSCYENTLGERCEGFKCPGAGGVYGECNGLGVCDNTKGTCSCYNQFEGQRDDCSESENKQDALENAVSISLVWGMDGYNKEDTSKPVWDERFDFNSEETRKNILHVIRNARNTTSLLVREDWISFPEKFFGSLTRREDALERFFQDGNLRKQYLLDVGTSGEKYTGRVKYVRALIRIRVKQNTAAQDLKKHYDAWLSFTENTNSDIFPSGPKMLMISDDWTRMEAELNVLGTTLKSFTTSMAITAFVVFISTGNIVLTAFTSITIFLTVCTLFGFLVYVMKYEFGAIQAMGVVFFVGLSVDFCLHINHHYNMSDASNPYEKVKKALQQVGLAVIQGGATTVVATFFLYPCHIYLFVQLGVMMCANITLALFYTFIFLCPMLLLCGPTGVRSSVYSLILRQWRWMFTTGAPVQEQEEEETEELFKVNLRHKMDLLKKVFDAYDTNDDGFIDLEETKVYGKVLGLRFLNEDCSTAFGGISTATSDDEVWADMYAAMCKKVNADPKKGLTLEEFYAYNSLRFTTNDEYELTLRERPAKKEVSLRSIGFAEDCRELSLQEIYNEGDRVFVRGRPEYYFALDYPTDWIRGVVTNLEPLRVRVDGWEYGWRWPEVRKDTTCDIDDPSLEEASTIGRPNVANKRSHPSMAKDGQSQSIQSTDSRGGATATRRQEMFRPVTKPTDAGNDECDAIAEERICDIDYPALEEDACARPGIFSRIRSSTHSASSDIGRALGGSRRNSFTKFIDEEPGCATPPSLEKDVTPVFDAGSCRVPTPRTPPVQDVISS